MKTSRATVAANRERIVSAAARLFRSRGFDAVSVAEVMEAAGLTHGAFYSYFASKDALFVEALTSALDVKGYPDELVDYAEIYLSPRHRDGAADGCAVSALGTECGRRDDAARTAMTLALERQIARFTRSGRTRDEAIRGWAAMLGAMVLSRAVDDDALSREVLDSVRLSFSA